MMISLWQFFANTIPPHDVFNTFLLAGVLKTLFVVGFGIYAIFAFIVTRQISNMRRTLSTSASLPIRMVGYIHLTVAMVLFFAALLLL